MKKADWYYYPAVLTYEDGQEIAVEFPDLDVATSGADGKTLCYLPVNAWDWYCMDWKKTTSLFPSLPICQISNWQKMNVVF